MFEIRFIGRPVTLGSVFDELEPIEAVKPVIHGEVRIKSHHESFIAPLTYWTPPEYEAQWMAARESLSHGAERACFIVSVDLPSIRNEIEVWGVWRRDDEFRLQNRRLLHDVLGARRLQAPAEALGPYSLLDENGARIEDWSLPLDSLWR